MAKQSTAAETLGSVWLVTGLAVAAIYCLFLLVTGATFFFAVGSLDTLYFSSVLAATAAMILGGVLLVYLPMAMNHLWEYGALRTGSIAPTSEVNSATPPEAGEPFGQYITRFERQLHRLDGNGLCGLGSAALLVLAWDAAYGLDSMLGFATSNPVPFFRGWGFQLIVAFVLGMLAWRMFVIGYEIRRLGNTLELNLQLNHPDGAGGLSPIGQICFANAMIVSVAAIQFGAWLIVFVINPDFGHGYASRWTSPYVQWLLVTIVLATLTLIVPLISVHRAMVKAAEPTRNHLNTLAARIDQVSKEVLKLADTGKPSELEALSRDLQRLKDVYANNRNVPTWPVPKAFLRNYSLTQAIPLAGLALEIGKTVIHP